MKYGTDLPALAARIQAIAASAKDYILPARSLRMTPAGELAWSTKDEGIMLPANRVASQQISSYCEIPRDYFDRCPTQLRAHNVNHWLDTHGDERRLVRVAEGNVRALLSDRYRPLDNYPASRAILSIIQSRACACSPAS